MRWSVAWDGVHRSVDILEQPHDETARAYGIAYPSDTGRGEPVAQDRW